MAPSGALTVAGIEAKLMEYLMSEEAQQEAEMSIDEVATLEHNRAILTLTYHAQPAIAAGLDMPALTK